MTKVRFKVKETATTHTPRFSETGGPFVVTIKGRDLLVLLQGKP